MSTVTSIRMSDAVSEYIGKLPKKEKSRFINNALDKAVKDARRREALKLLTSIERIPSPDGKGSVELLAEYRSNREQELLHASKEDD